MTEYDGAVGKDIDALLTNIREAAEDGASGGEPITACHDIINLIREHYGAEVQS